MKISAIGVVVVLLTVCSHSLQIHRNHTESAENFVPFHVIGILTTARDANFSGEELPTYVRDSYIKWVELSGAKFVPIKVFEDRQSIEETLTQLNGVLIPGNYWNLVPQNFASRLFPKELDVVRFIFDYAKSQKDVYHKQFPIMGICFGFETMVYMTASGSSPQNPIVEKVQEDKPRLNTVFFQEVGEEQSILKHLPEFVKEKVQNDSEGLMVFHHSAGLHLDTYRANIGLRNFWNVLGTTVANEEPFVQYVSFISAKEYPFYATQFLPQSAVFEWYEGIGHKKYESIAFSHLLSMNFVEKCRQNGNRMTVQRYSELSKIEDCNSIKPHQQPYSQKYTYLEKISIL